MIHVPCYICGNRDVVPLVTQTAPDPFLSLVSERLNEEARAIVACANCGLVFHSPRLSDEEIALLYERYRDVQVRGETPDEYFDRITSLPPDRSYNYAKVQELNEIFRRYLPENGARVVCDVGAGGGVLLKTFLDHAEGDWEAHGVEPTPSYAELASRRLGINVISGLYRPGLFTTKFDLMTLVKVLEHITDPVNFLKGIRGDLKPHGILYLEVPSVREVVSLPADHPQLRAEHIYFYSVETLALVARRAGFEVLQITERPAPDAGEWDLIAVLRPGEPEEHDRVGYPLNDPELLLRALAANAPGERAAQ